MSIPFIARPYQRQAIDHVHQTTRGALFAGMGMGKTSGTIAAALDLELVEQAFPMLVLAPLRVANSTWPDEVKKWDQFSGLRVSPITGSVSERRAALRRKAEIYTINYENIPWLVEELGGKWPFAFVVSDESTKLKGFRTRQGTQRAAAIGKIAHTKLKRWLNLTGTPSPNGLKDLWGQTWFLDGGFRLGRSFSAFESRWFQKSFNGFGLSPLPHAQTEISERISDICFSINAVDHFDIKEPIVTNIEVDLPRKARDAYREMEKELFTEIEGNPIEAMNAAAKTNKCLQLANGAAYVRPGQPEYVEVHDAKIQALEDIIEEAAGMPVLVAYNFVSDRERLLRAFKTARHLDKNPQTIREWNAGKIPILLAHPASAGHGLNLQDGGNILVFFGLNWNLEEHLQIIERIGPMRQIQSGHNRPMFIYNIIARDTLDDLVLERLKSKRSVQDILLDALNRRKSC